MAEAFVAFFAALVAKDLADVSGGVLAGATAAFVVACVVVTGLLRHRWAYVVGSVLQVLLIATGFVVPAMFALGAVFAGLWIAALVLAKRVERVHLAR